MDDCCECNEAEVEEFLGHLCTILCFLKGVLVRAL